MEDTMKQNEKAHDCGQRQLKYKGKNDEVDDIYIFMYIYVYIFMDA